jgi:hypothetical protein
LRSIEDVRGGRGADVLLGDDGPNSLESWQGADRFDGRGGDDNLDARGWDGGPARLLGGQGDDLLFAPGGWADCGEGQDALSPGEVAGVATRETGCEWIGLNPASTVWVSRSVRRVGQTLVVTVRSRHSEPVEVLARVGSQPNPGAVGDRPTLAPGQTLELPMTLTTLGGPLLATTRQVGSRSRFVRRYRLRRPTSPTSVTSPSREVGCSYETARLPQMFALLSTKPPRTEMWCSTISNDRSVRGRGRAVS